MKTSARELAEFLHATIDGDPDIEVTHPSKIEEAGPGSISFIGNPKYESFAYTTQASILVVPNEFKAQRPLRATLLRVENVYQSLGNLLSRFENNGRPVGISDQASINETVSLGAGVAVGQQSVIEKNAVIGQGSLIYAQVYIGDHVTIGRDCTIYPGVKIYSGCRIGDRCVIHSNTVIGSDGFGFVPSPEGRMEKIPQLGNVELGDEVEIGSGCTIDRATMGSTRIGNGCKLDNLIQIAHNVEVGENTVIAAQAGIAGSTKIGARCMIGGQVGIAGHLRIPDGTQIQAQSGIMSAPSEPNQKLFGYPAISYHDYLRAYAIFRKLPELEQRLRDLEKPSEE